LKAAKDGRDNKLATILGKGIKLVGKLLTFANADSIARTATGFANDYAPYAITNSRIRR